MRVCVCVCVQVSTETLACLLFPFASLFVLLLSSVLRLSGWQTKLCAWSRSSSHPIEPEDWVLILLDAIDPEVQVMALEPAKTACTWSAIGQTKLCS